MAWSPAPAYSYRFGEEFNLSLTPASPSTDRMSTPGGVDRDPDDMSGPTTAIYNPVGMPRAPLQRALDPPASADVSLPLRQTLDEFMREQDINESIAASMAARRAAVTTKKASLAVKEPSWAVKQNKRTKKLYQANLNHILDQVRARKNTNQPSSDEEKVNWVGLLDRKSMTFPFELLLQNMKMKKKGDGKWPLTSHSISFNDLIPLPPSR